jgi:hypothetical protein
MGADEVQSFLSYLAVKRNVAASTQNQAKSALLFLYRNGLHIELPWLDEVIAAKAGKRLPVVLTSTEFCHTRPAKSINGNARHLRLDGSGILVYSSYPS